MTGAKIAPVVILAYDGVAADEAGTIVGIMVAADIPVLIASIERRPVTSYHGRVVATRRAAQITKSSALIIPGGMGVRTAVRNPALTAAIATVGAGARYLGATSTGSVLLVAAGLADNARITTHWLATELLSDADVRVENVPFVHDGRVLTASGVASTATLAFRLVGVLLGPQAEAAARLTYQPPSPPVDRRKGRGSWWKKLFSRPGPAAHAIDPTGAADLIILDWGDSPPTPSHDGD